MKAKYNLESVIACSVNTKLSPTEEKFGLEEQSAKQELEPRDSGSAAYPTSVKMGLEPRSSLKVFVG